jgi:hypothetical protein
MMARRPDSFPAIVISSVEDGAVPIRAIRRRAHPSTPVWYSMVILGIPDADGVPAD